MSIIARGKAALRYLIKAVPPGYLQADSPAAVATHYIRAADLPDEQIDDLIEAGSLEPWRVSADGEPWFRATDPDAVENWSPHTCPMVGNGLDDGDFADGFDPYAIPADSPAVVWPDADDDDDDFDSRNPYRWSGNP